MIAQALEDVLRDACTPARVREVEAGAGGDRLWRVIADTGFLDLMVPEEAGGAGVEWSHAYPVFELLGRHAVPAPVAPTIIARALLAHAQAAFPEGSIALASRIRDGGSGRLDAVLVPFGLVADHVLAEVGDSLILVSCAAAERVATGVYGSQSAHLRWSAAEADVRVPRRAPDLLSAGAAIHAAIMAGAMNRVFELTQQYANDRVQFGRSIGRFQAVQHQLSVMAEQVSAAGTAAQLAFQSEPTRITAGVAKARCSEAASRVCAMAHAVHGAIGVTQEYDLQLLTRRLHEWRMSEGSEDFWHAQVGRRLLDSSESTTLDFVRAFS